MSETKLKPMAAGKKQKRGASIRVKLLLSFTVVAMVSVAIVGLIVYNSYRNQIREDIRQRLLNIISITALQQDGDLHATIRTAEDMQSETYAQMQAVNAAILATDRDLEYIFTVRQNEQGQIYFVLDNGLAEGYEPVETGVIYEDPSELLAANIGTLDHPIVEQDFYTDIYGTFLSAYAPIYRSDGTREGIVGVDIVADKVIAEERQVLQLILGTTVAALAVVTVISLVLGYLFVRPIANLAAVAQEIAQGNLSARAKVETADEIGNLGTIFNNMAAQLQQTLEGLEERVAVATRDLALAAEVGQRTSLVRDPASLLAQAAELIRERFDLYYTQIYLTDPTGRSLILSAGTGEAGRALIRRGHRLPVDLSSINGIAAAEQHAVIVEDTATSAIHRPNPLLPDTRSEMAVPLIAGERVVGVLDMQSSQPGALRTENLSAFEILAGQLAITIINANLFAEIERAREEIENQARRLSRSGWEDFLDAIQQRQRLGYSYEEATLTPIIEPLIHQKNETTLETPIQIAGETIGVLQFENDRPWTEDDDLIATVVARQVAQQVENLRLLAQAERYQAEAEQALRRLTRQSWETYQAQTGKETIGFLYDTYQVRPIEEADALLEKSLVQAITVRDEPIGELTIAGQVQLSPEDLELVETVSAQLSEQIESLRLSQQTELALSETRALYRFSESISREMDLQAIYNAIACLIVDEIGFSGSWVASYERTTDLLKGQAGVNLPQERIVAHIPVAQTRMPTSFAVQLKQTVIINDPLRDARMNDVPEDVKLELGRSIAVPIFVGAEVIGVLAATRPVNAPSIGEREERMLQLVASQSAIAIQRAQLFEQTNTALEAVQQSEAQLAEALEIAHLGYWEYDLESDLFTFNDQFYSIFHTTAEKVGGYRLSSAQYAQQFVHPEDASLVQQEIGKALASTERFFNTSIEHRFQYAGGGIGYMSVSVNVERDESGKIIRWYGANQDISDRKRAEEDLSKRVRELNCLSDIGHMIDEQPALEEFLQRVAERIPAAMQFPQVCLAAITLGDQMFGAEQTTSLPHKMVGGIRVGGNLIGHVHIAYTEPHTFLDEESSFIGGVVGRVSSYIESLQAYQQVQRRTEELDILNEMGRSLTSLQDEQAIYETIFEYTGKLMDVSSFHIALYDQDRHQYTLPIITEQGQRMQFNPQPAGNSLTDYIIRTQKPLLFSANVNVQARALGIDPMIVGEDVPTLSWLGVPLLFQNRVLGVIAVQSDTVPGLYTDHERDLLTAIASQAAIALENAFAFKQAQQQAEHEAMINLISQRIQSTTSVENALQVAIRELGRALGAKRTSVQLGGSAPAASQNSK